MDNLDLTIELTDLRTLGPAAALAMQRPHPLICDRCHDDYELVVTVMKILSLEQAWTLCGPCVRELPAVSAWPRPIPFKACTLGLQRRRQFHSPRMAQPPGSRQVMP